MFKHIVICIACLFSSLALADYSSKTPLGLGVVPPVQFPNSQFLVSGIRLSLLWGQNRGVNGIDLGLIGNITDQESRGLALSGIFNLNHGQVSIYGLQLAGVTNINESKTEIFGVQASLANLGYLTNIHGVQLGVYNRANHVYGLQIGIVNFASNLHGLQVGLANFNLGGPFSVAPVLNVGF